MAAAAGKIGAGGIYLQSRLPLPYPSLICRITVRGRLKTKGNVFKRPLNFHSIFTRFNFNALPNTETELAAIAAPAMTGFKKPSAASGMPKIL